MRTILIGAILALFSTHSFALDQNTVNTKIASIKQKAASGQDVKGDIAALTEELKANAKSLVVTNQVNLSVIDHSGTVSLFVPFPATTNVIANNPELVEHAKAAIAKHPEANKAHDNIDGAVSLGGSSKKKDKAPAAPADPSAAPASTSSGGGIGDLIGAGLSTIMNIGSGLISGILGAV
ncbi:MAG: hypothetical protein Q8L85_08160 [Alphaproteobacteria bacterium]|nr:hypothetical protein [Alphaproteobacteria bacterium]